MTHRQSRRQHHTNSSTDHLAARSGHERSRTLREHLKQEHSSSQPRRGDRTHHSSLTTLIERDAPLQAHSGLVLMYGPFQAELLPQEGRGVASWLKDCVHKHGIPSLVRFDYRRRAQIFRRDQFQPWLEPLLSKISS